MDPKTLAACVSARAACALGVATAALGSASCPRVWGFLLLEGLGPPPGFISRSLFRCLPVSASRGWVRVFLRPATCLRLGFGCFRPWLLPPPSASSRFARSGSFVCPFCFRPFTVSRWGACILGFPFSAPAGSVSCFRAFRGFALTVSLPSWRLSALLRRRFLTILSLPLRAVLPGAPVGSLPARASCPLASRRAPCALTAFRFSVIFSLLFSRPLFLFRPHSAAPALGPFLVLSAASCSSFVSCSSSVAGLTPPPCLSSACPRGLLVRLPVASVDPFSLGLAFSVPRLPRSSCLRSPPCAVVDVFFGPWPSTLPFASLLLCFDFLAFASLSARLFRFFPSLLGASFFFSAPLLHFC